MKDIKGIAIRIVRDKNGSAIPITRQRVIGANKYSSYYQQKVEEVKAKEAKSA